MAHFRYAGEYYDIETGNYYLKARYYNPSTGRFTQVDTFLGYADNVLSLNRYTYCHNNPIMFVDPSGHTSYSIYGAKVTFDENQVGNHENMILGERMIAVQQGYQPLDYFLQYAREIGLYVDIEFEDEFYNNNTSSDAQDFHHETIYDLSRSSLYSEVQLAEKYIEEGKAYKSNNESLTSSFIRYYVYRNGGIGKGNENMYQLIYDCPPNMNRYEMRDSTTTNMYGNYYFSVFDALGWMVLTRGNVNIITQTRIVSETEKAAKYQFNIINKFIDAIDLMLNANFEDILIPDFYVGSTEWEGPNSETVYGIVSTALDKRFKENPMSEKFSEKLAHESIIEGVYFGNETPAVQGFKSNYPDLKTIWIPYLGANNTEGVNSAKSNIEQVIKNKTFDVIIIQPGAFYSAYDEDAIPEMFKAVKDLINKGKTEGVSVGVEYEFDMGLVTGRTRWVNTEYLHMDSQTKKDRFNVSFYEIAEIIEDNPDIPIGIYSGGPNEQGMRNIVTNNNQHNLGNHLPYIPELNTNYQISIVNEAKYNDLLQYNKSYSQFEGNKEGENIIYDISDYLFNGNWSDYLYNDYGLKEPKLSDDSNN